MKWVPDMTDEARREFVRAWLQGRIFSSRHLARDRQEHMLGNVFYPILFGALGPPMLEVPECPDKIPEDMSVEEFDELLNGGHQAAVERVEQINEANWTSYKSQVGLIWEYIDKSLPRSVNGYPIFMSCRVMSGDDWEKIWPVLEREEDRLANIEV